ncbi:MAG: uracil-DNA glycosylase [Acidobacterium ailaaui]|nr:uracil-DNA glycosylase [Pseudacidobacterium ailaaui]
MSLTPEMQQALAARLRYYRDLGVGEFYRRGNPERNVSCSEIPEPVPEDLMSRTQARPAPAAELFVDATEVLSPEKRADALRLVQQEIGECTRCPLAFLGRHTIVFGEGDPNARLLFVGEGPGADEDMQGRPFVGRAGQLLNNMISAMGLKREQVYIANVVKCRPPQNRTPEPVEATTCSQFLFRQIDILRPEVIVALGATAATYLLNSKSALGGLRGRLHEVRGAKLVVTYHPAYLLRDPRQKKEAWKDLQLAMAELGLSVPKRSNESNSSPGALPEA